MLNQNQLNNFAVNGFVKGSKVLTDDQVEVLRAETLRVIEDADNGTLRERVPVKVANISGKPENPVWQIINIWEGSAAFEELVVRNVGIVEEVAQLMRANMAAQEIRLFHDQIQYKPAQTGGVNMWHQDSPYWPILTPKDVQLTAWVALDEVDGDNGCMSMVPRSHLWGDQIQFLHTIADFRAMPSCFEGHDVEVVPCPVEKGAVHFHHPLTWHGSPANRSGRPRRAIALHFMTESALFKADGAHPMKPFVEGGAGEKVAGEHFPLVWSA